MSVSAPILHRGRSLSLRRTVPEDAPLLFRRAYQNLEFMQLFRLNDRPADVDEVRSRLETLHQQPPDSLGYLELMIVHHQHGPVGLVVLSDYAALHRRAEFLIGLFDTAHRHASYGLEASLMTLDLAFNAYALNRVYAYTYAYNQPAQKGLTSLGFLLEGVLVEHVFDRSTEKFVDLHCYGMTAHQFRQAHRLVSLAQRLIGRDITQPASPHPLPQPTPPPQFIKSGTFSWR
ncbi:MAG TPA: GNAT family protein [Coleofasciculaceae cyanobacterium]